MVTTIEHSSLPIGDAHVPKLHVSSHATGGSDALTAANIGALAVANNLSDVTAATARTNLAVYSSAEADSAIDADIATHAALTETHGISAFGASLVNDASASAARTTMGLGTIATQDADDVTVTGGTLTGTNLSNPNILINTNGKDPVNQREIADTNALTTGDYMDDRWFVTHDVTALAADVQADGIGISITTAGAGTAAKRSQLVESYEAYQGKTLTASISLIADNAAKLFIADGVGTTESSAHTGGGTAETLSVSRPIDGSATKLEVGISLALADGNYSEIEWIKLEEGSNSTVYTIPDPEIELYRCGEPDDSSTYGYRSTRDIIHRPNILINSDLSNPINQRDYSNGDSVTDGIYTLDRWMAWSNCTSTTQRITSTGAGLNCVTAGAGTYVIIYQKVEAYESFRGKTVTLTARVKSNSANAKLRLRDGVSVVYSSAHSGGGSFEELSVSLNVSASAYYLDTAFLDLSPVDGLYLEIEWIKLEEGSSATTWVVPDPQQELARCLRYFERIDAIDAGTKFGTGISLSTDSARTIVPMNSKRDASACTVSFSGTFYLFHSTTATVTTSNGFANRGRNTITIANNVASGLTAGDAVIFGVNGDANAYIDIDAEL